MPIDDYDLPPSFRVDMVDEARPSDWYQPGRLELDEADRYQLQFHKSRHTVRLLVLGNGAGKTTTVGVEADWWAQGRHPYQLDLPKTPVQIIWICQKFLQFEKLRPQLERRCFTPGFLWNKTEHTYTWPNGSTITVFSDEGGWEGIQGINPHLIVVDEECDPALWRELTMRRRGDNKTRFIIAATATRGKRWMYHEIFKPWLERHAAAGLTEELAMHRQLHEHYWCWPRGGLLDNPITTQADVDWYRLTLAKASAQERMVRSGGGFADMNQSPVFDHEALDQIEVYRRAPGPATPGQPGQTDEQMYPGVDGVLVDGMPGPQIASGRTVIGYGESFVFAEDLPGARARFEFLSTGGEWEGGRLTVYDLPEPDGIYVVGADFAQGLVTGDFDAAEVCKVEGHRLIQVAELQGRLGQTRMPPMLASLGWFYNMALIVGEANSMGLGNLRWMYERGYHHQYVRELKPDAKVAVEKTDRLGYWKGSPLPINLLQWKIAPRKLAVPAGGGVLGVRQEPELVIRSYRLMEELRRYSFKPRATTAAIEDTPDEKLVMGAESGYHDDLVSALAGCVIGQRDLPRFTPPKPQFRSGSLGEVLGHKHVGQKHARKGPFANAKQDRP